MMKIVVIEVVVQPSVARQITIDQWTVTGDQEDAIGFVSPTAVSGSSDLNKVDIHYKYMNYKYYIASTQSISSIIE